MMHTRPLVMEKSAVDPCATCSARPYSVCSAIEDKDLARLAALAQTITITAGRSFIEEGDPA